MIFLQTQFANYYLILFFYLCKKITLIEFIEKIDFEILKTLNIERNRYFDNFFIIISNSIEYLVFIIPFLFLIYYFIKRDKQRLKNFYFVSLNLILTALIITLIKYIVNRPRPYTLYQNIEKISVGGSPSFPSGHTSDAFALAFACLFIFKNKIYSIPIFFWALLVGYSRIHNGVHYTTDVIFGIIFSFLISILFYKKKFNK